MLLRWRRDETRERELRRIKKTIKLTMNSQDRAVRGIVDILFTVDREETDIFKKKNEACRARGESYFTRVKNDIYVSTLRTLIAKMITVNYMRSTVHYYSREHTR